MADITTKIVDNTFISACIRDIVSVKLIQVCANSFNLATSKEVYNEAIAHWATSVVDLEYKNIQIYDMNKDKNYLSLLNYLRSRYPYLHDGELSSFLVALLNYDIQNKKYYYLTDDGKMRKTIPKIMNDTIFLQFIGKSLNSFNYTGTIGLLKRLFEKKTISQEEISKIILDLKNGDFHITPELIKYLKV